MAKQTSELSWEKRLLIISYKNEKDQIFTKTKKFISDNKCEIDDRNLEIIFFTKFKNKDFVTPDFIKNKFGIWLIGYDGEVKSFSLEEKFVNEIFYLIDQMPIRQQEMLMYKKKC